MVKVCEWIDGQKVIRDALPEDLPPPRDLDAEADQALKSNLDQNAALKALGMVMADLAVAAGLAADQATARQLVRDRFRTHYRSLLG